MNDRVPGKPATLAGYMLVRATYSDLLRTVQAASQLVVLTGAGISTESGIPDYRSPLTGSYSHGHKPMVHDDFVSSDAMRKRYWARSMHGWRPFSSKSPNSGHSALAVLESAGIVRHLITQNVDGLHQQAGSRRVIELHGSSHRVRCLSCGATEPRSRTQSRLNALNHWWLTSTSLESSQQLRADGDAGDEPSFRVPPCTACGGVLKPDVVFFGDVVPKRRADEAMELVLGADALFVVGTSLSTLSAYRLVVAAAQRGTPICVLTQGETRAERQPVPHMKLEAQCGPTLSQLGADLLGSRWSHQQLRPYDDRLLRA